MVLAKVGGGGSMEFFIQIVFLLVSVEAKDWLTFNGIRLGVPLCTFLSL